VPALCQTETIFIRGRCFSEIRNVPDWLDLAPRVAAVYDVFGNGKTAIKLAANRYHIGIGSEHQFRVTSIRGTSDTRPWMDRNGDRIPQLDELGASTGFNLGTTNRYNPDLKRPYSNEFSIEIEQQIFGDVVVSAGFYHRQTRRNIGSRNLAVPRESYIPLNVVERNSGRQVTVHNQEPSLRGRFDVLFDNFKELDSHFNGFDVTFNKRFTDGWMLMGGLSHGKNVGDTFGVSDLNNPNFTFRRGVIGDDVPWAFKLAGIYDLPLGIRLSGNVQHFTGFPESVSVLVTSASARLTQVNQSLRVEPRGTNRLPNNNLVDLSLRKIFQVQERMRTEVVMDIFNLLNANSIQDRVTQLGPAYGRVSNILRGRLWRFGLNVNF
jgi:hypothetical protein